MFQKINTLPQRLRKEVYAFDQKLSDNRPKALINTQLAINQLKQPIEYDIFGTGFERTIKFKDIFEGLILPNDHFDASKIDAFYFEPKPFNYRSKFVQELKKQEMIPEYNLTKADIDNDVNRICNTDSMTPREFEMKIRCYIKDTIESRIHGIINLVENAMIEDVKFKNILPVMDFRFNRALFWLILYNRDFVGAEIDMDDILAAFTYQGTEKDVMYHTVRHIESCYYSSEVKILNKSFFLLPVEVKEYYTHYHKLVSDESFKVISELTAVKIAWSYDKIKDVEDFVLSMMSDKRLIEKTSIYACHQYFRFNHLHFHYFSSKENLLKYMVYNIYRSWQKYVTLQRSKGYDISGRNNYNFATTTYDLDVLRMQLLASMPPAAEFDISNDITIPLFLQMYGDIMNDVEFIKILLTFSIIPNYNKYFYIYSVLDNSYIELFMHDYYVLRKITCKIEYTKIFRSDRGRVANITYKDPVSWIQLPTGNAVRMPSKQKFITAQSVMRFGSKRTVLNKIRAFNGFSIRLWINSQDLKYDNSATPEKMRNKMFSIYWNSYISHDYWQMRDLSSELAGNRGNYDAKYYCDLYTARQNTAYFSSWTDILWLSLFTYKSGLQLNDDIFKGINAKTKYNTNLNKSSIKLMDAFIKLLQETMDHVLREKTDKDRSRDNYDQMFKELRSEDISVQIFGDIKDPVKMAIKNACPDWTVSGIGDTAYVPGNRSKIEFMSQRKVSSFIICDVDQAGEDCRTYDDMIKKILTFTDICMNMCSFGFIMKIQYCNSDVLSYICTRINPETTYRSWIYKPSSGPQYSCEWFLIVVKINPDPTVGDSDTPTWRMNKNELSIVDNGWNEFKNVRNRGPIESKPKILINSEILNQANLINISEAHMTVACSLSFFRTMLQYMLNVSSQVTTGRIADQTDAYILHGFVDRLRSSLYNRDNKVLQLQIEDNAIRSDSVGYYNKLPFSVYFGQNSSANGLYNLAHKIQKRHLVDEFKRVIGKTTITYLDIGSGYREDASVIYPNDEYICIEPQDIPGGNTRNVLHIKEEFNWDKHIEYIDKADVIVMSYSAFNIYATQEFLTLLTEKITPYINENNLINQKPKKLFIFNYYTFEGFYKYYKGSILQGWIPHDLRYTITVNRENINIWDKVTYTFGAYEEVEAIKISDINKNLGVDNKPLFKIDPITYTDLYNAAVMYSRTHNMYLGGGLLYYTEMVPTFIAGIPPRTEWEEIEYDICDNNDCI